MDGVVGAYKHHGCASSIVYHAAAEHNDKCAHAPCYCFECTPPFEGSPAQLLRHLTAPSGKHRHEAAVHGRALGGWSAGHRRPRSVQVKGSVASCSVPGEVDMEQGWLHAHVNPSMLHGDSGEVHLRLRITKFP
ncbi:hypothetical protein ZWY2020_031475 [Hordeum vulgare]|nr:hypothetical protein ZWY2020_031475 [Hordeum vulgare]